MAERIQIRCKYALGDVVVLTAAVRDLSRAYPGQFHISVDSGHPEVWLHNPYVQQSVAACRTIDCKDAFIDRAGTTRQHYVGAYLNLLNGKLGTQAPLSEIKGDLHLSREERSWYSDIWSLCGKEIPYWLIGAGGKFDLPIKWWDERRYQKVVNALRGKVQFVQVGQWGNHHPRLEGVIDLRGKTSVRDLIHLVYHADGVLCGVTSLMHLAAAVPNGEVVRTAIVVAGNREPRTWEAYPGHEYLTAGDDLDCGNCWNNRISHSEAGKKGICNRVANDLPECLDHISAETVIDAFERLHRNGRIRYLSARQVSVARKAIEAANSANSFDAHNLNPRNAAVKAAEFLETISDYPKKRFNGRGIVICAGGSGYFTQAWVCIRMLRQAGCTLPVEVWHIGSLEIDERMERLLARLDVECVNAREHMRRAPMRNPLGWELKCYAVLNSKFREVLSLDADNVPIIDPTFLFTTLEYRDTGAIFWPDYRRLGRKRTIWKVCGVQYRDEPEFESGQMVINKEKCWRALNLAWWYNDHSEFFFKHIHGDKDTFHLAWRRTGTEYAMPPYPIESLEGVMCQHDFTGRRIFQHRNSHKWSFFGENRRIKGFLLEEDCRAHLEELRGLWDGRIGGERVHGKFLGAKVRADTVDREVFQGVALQNEYRLPARFNARDVILDVGAHIGSFTRACHDRGSREIHAFEPHPENFALARENVAGLPGVHLQQAAVLDKAATVALSPFPKDIGKQNTGGVQVLNKAGEVKSCAINDLLEQLGYVTLLKLDCEGSEWQILSGVREWKRIGAICGEYHAQGFDAALALSKLLRGHFPYLRIGKPNHEGLGKFWASHIRSYFSDDHFRHRPVRRQHR